MNIIKNLNFIGKLFIALSWAGFIFAMIGTPMPYPAWPQPETFYDKGIHLIMFGILSFLLIWSLLEKMNIKKAILFGLFLSVAYNLGAEYYQGYVPGREPDLFDFSVGVAGTLLAAWYAHVIFYDPKPKLLLHICCVGCGAFVAGELKKDFNVSLYFYNPNIWPERESELRLEEAKKIARRFSLPLIVNKGDHKNWLGLAKGLEKEPEKGRRCLVCYRHRLEVVARYAAQNNFNFFTTTLTISPHKDAKAIGAIGNELAEKYKVKYLDKDFKKNDGFKKSACLSRDLGLYRQDYCGCEFSISKK